MIDRAVTATSRGQALKAEAFWKRAKGRENRIRAFSSVCDFVSVT